MAIIFFAGEVQAGPTRELFQLIETQKYTEAERDIRRALETARGEDRNIYLFVMGFVLVKEGRAAEARAALAAIDPKSEWADEGRFLLQIYGGRPAATVPSGQGGGPLVSIQIAAGPFLNLGPDRFTRAGRTLRKNGTPVPSPFELPPEAAYERRTYRGKMEIAVENDRLALINTLPVEEYLYGVLKNEIGPSWHEEALKAQAIASRTFVLRRMELARANSRGPVRLSSDVSIQVYRGRAAEDPRVTAAVDATRGQVLTYGGDLIESVFHSESGGVTESADDLWGGGYPYLLSRPDPYAGTSPRSEWEAEFSEADILKSLDKSSRAKLGRIRKIEIAQTTVSGRVKVLSIQGARGRITVPAGKFRLSLGPDKLRSLYWTDVSYEKGRLKVDGRGWGHGVGMPQWSAKVAAEKGMSCGEILKYYFSGTEIVTKY